MDTGPPESLVVIELLNSPRLIVAKREALRLERKDAALLCMLSLDGPAARRRVASLLWPGSDVEAARASLRQRLFRIRKATGVDVILPEGDLRLAESVTADVAEMKQRISADPGAMRGELLGNVAYDDCEELNDWVSTARERWRASRRDVIADCAARLEAEGRIAEALLYAERLVAEDPLHEHGHRRLMRLHYLRGDRSAALRVFERCRDLLQRELRTVPGRETVELARLVERSDEVGAARAARPTPAGLLRPPRLVGRRSEWKQLEAARSARRSILISGEAGMGKSRLLGDFAAANGAAVIGARPGDARVPYSLLGRMLKALSPRFGLPAAGWAVSELARIAPELGPSSAQRADELRLRRAVATAVATWRAAGLSLFVLDDLHFADEASLELLPPLSAESGLPWLFGARPSELHPVVERWLNAEGTGGLMRIRLTPLDEAEIVSLLDSLAIATGDTKRWAAALLRHTGGNPMFILETLAALVAEGGNACRAADFHLPVPDSVGELIRRRLSQLSAPALRLAQVAAIAGQDFSAALAAEVLKVHPIDLSESWRELEQAHVLVKSAFAHDLLQEAALTSLPAPIAELLHADVAAFLERNGGVAVRTAQHYAQATLWAKAGEHFRSAAHAAAAVGRNDEQTRLLERAAESFVRAGDSTNAVLAFADLANAHLTFSRFPAAWAAVQRARAVARSPQERLWCLHASADIHNNAREHEQALASATEALALATELNDERARFNAARKAAGALGTLGRYEESLRLYDAQHEFAAEHERDADVLVYLCDRGYLLEQAGRSLEAVEAYGQTIEAARRASNLPVENAALTNLAVTFWRLGQYAKALASADEAVAVRLRLGGGRDDSLVDRAQRAAILRDLGCFGEALAGLEAVLPGLRAQGAAFWTAAVEDHLALLFVLLGQPGRTGALITTGNDASAAAKAHRLTLCARIERLGGHSGLRFAREAADLVAGTGPVRLHLLAKLESACALGATEGAALALEVAEQAAARQSAGLQAHALYRASERLLAAGRLDESVAHLRSARNFDDRRLPFGMYTPEKDWIAYQVFAAVNDKETARGALQIGHHWIAAALPNVPEEFRNSFMHRNPINQAILNATTRLPVA